MVSTALRSYWTVRCIIVALSLVGSTIALGQTRHDIFIRIGESDSLDATYYAPETSPPASGYPALLFVHGFGLDKDWQTASCSAYAHSGYLSLAYSVRGHGSSSGQSTIMSRQERDDLPKVIEYLRGLPNVDTSRIGVIGGSQGGLHGLWGAADRLPVDAISADVIVPHWASDMLANGSIRRMLVVLLSEKTVRYDGIRDTLWEMVRTDSYDSLLAKFPVERDVDTARLSSATIPLLWLLKWQDHYFAAGDGIEAFGQYAGPKKMYIGTLGHFSDIAESERGYQDSQVTRWFDYFLRNRQTGILDEPMYTYAYSHLHMDTAGFFQWTRVGEPSWLPVGVHPVKFYLNVDSALSYAPPTNLGDSLILQNDYLNPAYTFDTAFIEGFKGPRFDALLPKRTIIFTSPPLDNDVRWVGTPKMKLFVHSEQEKFPIHAQVYEVDNTGTKYFINRINFTARHWQPGTSGWIEVEGIPHAHQFFRGNRIRIELTNIDRTNRVLYGIFPFVVPMFAQASATIYADAVHPSYIELPMIGSPTSVQLVSQDIPARTELFQNYPNPFNPETNFGFRISDFGLVSLKVYDVLGREVITLVDEVKQPGEYRVRWDARQTRSTESIGRAAGRRLDSSSGLASGLPSGVYFYRLQAGTTAMTRKMLLLR